MTPEDLDRWHDEQVAKRRAHLRERYQFLTSKIAEAEAVGADTSIIKSLRTLLSFVIRDANLLDRDEAIRALKPKAIVGEKFTAGRRPGTAGKLRKWVEKYLAKHPAATPSQAWAALAKKPPKGITVYTGFAPYLWVDGKGEVKLKTFQNLVGEVKKQHRQ